ncbi:MAG TPA: amidase family protein [Acidimicrobiales bacterium]|nr:amidase family protein [Acidimicrobiales bacterium]
MDFRRTTVAQLADDVASRRIAARELVEAALARIEEVDPSVNAFIALDPEGALAEAAQIDERVAAGEEVGPLTGIPIGVKDLEDAAGLPTTHGSAVYGDAPPATRDSVLVERLRAAGCVVVGKTNTPELGHKADTTNALFGSTRNPWDLSRSAGGSSGGSAAAVAAGMVPLCTGSDGGGSIRIPSAVCGLSGFKPSLGRVPMGGPTPPTWGGLSTKGPMARRVRDITLALDAVVGPDPTDLRSLPMPEASWTRSLEDLHLPRRVGWSPTLGYARVDREIAEVCARAVDRLADAGTEVVEIPTVFDEDPVSSWIRIAMVGGERSLGHLRGTPAWDLVDPLHARLIDAFGRDVTGAELVAAEDACHQLNLRLVELFHDVPLLLTPTVAGQTGPAGDNGTVDGEPTPGWVSLTYPFNMTCSPAGTVCAGFTGDGMPVGLQVVGPQHADVAVLRLLAALEDLFGFDPIPPL